MKNIKNPQNIVVGISTTNKTSSKSTKIVNRHVRVLMDINKKLN